GKPSDFTRFRQHAHEISQDDYIVQTRIAGDYTYSATAVTQSIQPGQSLNTSRVPQGRVLSILIAEQTAYMGISWAAQNVSPFTGGEMTFDEPVPNRAGHKLLEALATFKIRLFPGLRALDLGAAPGAWTEILRRRGVWVTAVAPREMYDWLQVDPFIQAVPVTAEEYLHQCDTTYDLLLNDMIVAAQDSARLMTAYAPHLRPGGIALMTLKLRMHDPRRLMDHTLRILRKAYTIVAVRQLVSNRKEVTLYLRR
ncbi:MAG: methyltransferase domain-containing protein, partial [Chloroflexaceae bacterium]|nr:methyltransferase domain-containing protein [Chloroflexaceae bacterium]